MDELNYEEQLKYYRGLLGINAEKTAQYQHAGAVFNLLSDWCPTVESIAQQLTNENAIHYMRYGVGRRLLMIFFAFREIFLTATPERIHPLSRDETEKLSREINVIYMHIRGVLDNFAWCFLYEKEPNVIHSLPRTSVDLFSRKFKELPAFSEIEHEILSHDSWNKEVKERRDPVAHRIPLYIPPSNVIEEEGETYGKLYREGVGHFNNLCFEDAQDKFDQLRNIGIFYPHFQHHPDQGTIPIYPTIPNDIMHLIQIGNTIKRSLLKI